MSDKSIAVPNTFAESSDVRDFWRLLKPNVMSLVVFSAGVGLYLAPGTIHPLMAVIAILCITVAAGASAAINNSYDVDIDRIMVRTRKRPTAAGRIDPADALAFGITLSVISIMMMGLAVNWLAASLLALTIAFYVFVYTMWLKATHAAEYRDRRCCGCPTADDRLGGRHGRSKPDAGHPVCDYLLLDTAAFLGACPLSFKGL